MKVSIFGSCSGTLPFAGRQHTAFAVTIDNRVYWFDAGEDSDSKIVYDADHNTYNWDVFFEEATTECTAIRIVAQYSAFAGCTKLTTFDFSRVTAAYNGAFSSCTGLKKVIIPDSVESIGDGAFKHCTNLESVMFPDSDIELGSDVFEGCPFLDEATKARIDQLTGE